MLRMEREQVVRATAAVFVAGGRKGSAVLVDARHLITAGHVLSRSVKPGEKTTVVEVEFSAVMVEGRPLRATARRADLGPAGAGVDLAVLDLGDTRPEGLPEPLAGKREAVRVSGEGNAG
jgi:hypothetical protein